MISSLQQREYQRLLLANSCSEITIKQLTQLEAGILRIEPTVSRKICQELVRGP